MQSKAEKPYMRANARPYNEIALLYQRKETRKQLTVGELELYHINKFRISMEMPLIGYKKESCFICKKDYEAQYVSSRKVDHCCNRCSHRTE